MRLAATNEERMRARGITVMLPQPFKSFLTPKQTTLTALNF
jgi:hypothetical protein